MGELFYMQQPRRRPGLPSTLGILGSSKGNTYAVGGEGSGSAPAVTPISPGQLSTVLTTLNAATNPLPPQRITATGATLPGPVNKAATLPRWVRPSPPGVWGTSAPIYVPVPYIFPGETPPAVAPGPPFPGGGGGGGGGLAAGDDQGAGADAPVFLGLTQKQLLIGGGVVLAAFLLLRKKKPGAAKPLEVL